MHPYREEPRDQPLVDLIKLDAEHSNIRGIRRVLTTVCAILSVAPWSEAHPIAWLPHGLVGAGVALWATAGLMALVCAIDERRLERLRKRALDSLEPK